MSELLIIITIALTLENAVTILWAKARQAWYMNRYSENSGLSYFPRDKMYQNKKMVKDLHLHYFLKLFVVAAFGTLAAYHLMDYCLFLIIIGGQYFAMCRYFKAQKKKFVLNNKGIIMLGLVIPMHHHVTRLKKWKEIEIEHNSERRMTFKCKSFEQQMHLGFAEKPIADAIQSHKLSS